MSSISKACMEISNSIRGFRLRGSPAETANGAGGGKDTFTAAVRTASSVSVTTTITRAIKSATSRVKAFDRNGHVAAPPPLPVIKPLPNVWDDEKFLAKFYFYFSPCERCTLVQVCKRWRDVLYQPKYWLGVTPIYNCKEWAKDEDGRRRFYTSLQTRGFDSICLFCATDKDVAEFVNNFAYSRKSVRSVALRCSNVTDAGLEVLMEKMTSMYCVELSGCNEITEAGLWACLNSRIVSLSISDCINVADDSVGAIAQLLPALYELNLQAYHVTDAALSFFSAKQSYTLSVLRLHSCWEVTNHGIVNVIHSLPNLTVLSLSGCSKVTDDGVELIAENLRKLKSLDLSWCPRITDAALEYIACDLGMLEELILDRCSHVTDIGVGYLSTMSSLSRLFLRWCTQLRDFGLQHLYTMRNLQVLSLAGCHLVTSSGLTGLVQLRSLAELELTNCPGATKDVCRYLKDNMPTCLIIE